MEPIPPRKQQMDAYLARNLSISEKIPDSCDFVRWYLRQIDGNTWDLFKHIVFKRQADKPSSGVFWPDSACGGYFTLSESPVASAEEARSVRNKSACMWLESFYQDDRDLLELMDRIGDLRDGAVRWYGGGFTSYADQVRAEQAAAERAVTTARADLRKQQHDRTDAERVLARRRRYGAKMYATKREPKVVMGMRKRSAQESAAKYRKVHEDRLNGARERIGLPRPPGSHRFRMFFSLTVPAASSPRQSDGRGMKAAWFPPRVQSSGNRAFHWSETKAWRCTLCRRSALPIP
jgi:hypothetical protein